MLAKYRLNLPGRHTVCIKVQKFRLFSIKNVCGEHKINDLSRFLDYKACRELVIPRFFHQYCKVYNIKPTNSQKDNFALKVLFFYARVDDNLIRAVIVVAITNFILTLIFSVIGKN